jgi:hypothetical protein
LPWAPESQLEGLAWHQAGEGEAGWCFLGQAAVPCEGVRRPRVQLPLKTFSPGSHLTPGYAHCFALYWLLLCEVLCWVGWPADWARACGWALGAGRYVQCHALVQEAANKADVACGLSLGEYTALAYAGAMSFEDGLRLVKLRGESMQAAADAKPSGMLSVIGLDADKVRWAGLGRLAGQPPGQPRCQCSRREDPRPGGPQSCIMAKSVAAARVAPHTVDTVCN